jgi:NAD(P)-dependent dehydrogenase (short-subunit alcohol dehydrogenase family)
MGSSASRAGGTTFNPVADIPNLTGKTILVTGGNSGLGRQSIIELSKHDPREIWLAARTLSKAEAAIEELKDHDILLPVQLAVIKPLEMDLASMDSVARAAEVVADADAAAGYLDSQRGDHGDSTGHFEGWV